MRCDYIKLYLVRIKIKNGGLFMSGRRDCQCDCDGDCDWDCNCECEECCCERKPVCKPKTKKANRSALKCGMPGAVTLPLATVAGTTFNVATVTVDTKHFCSPCIQFEFSSNIITTAAILTLNFQIFKQCGNQLVPLPVGPIWTFSRLVAVTESDSFYFVVCDCDLCN